MVIEIINIWLKIIGIIIVWEVWKHFAWRLIDWWVARHIKKYENRESKCPYLNGEMDE